MTAAERLAKQVKLSKELAEAHAHADRVLAQARAVASRRNGKVLSLPGKSPDAKRAEHKASTGDLRAFVEIRCEGRCEACRTELGSAWHMHHAESGPARRTNQRPGSVMALCFECHRRDHRNEVPVLKMIAQSSALDSEAKRAVERRIDKIVYGHATMAKINARRASRAAGGTR